jgi:hypothetical protein
MAGYRALTTPYLDVDIYGLKALNTLPDRMERYFHEALMVTVPPAVDAVINNAKSQLQPGHGYDTGRLHDSLTKEIISSALAMGVIYSLQSDEADYWASMEFGFMHVGGTFFPGYHFFQNAINANRGRLGKAAWQAWRVASARLAAEAMIQNLGIPKR